MFNIELKLAPPTEFVNAIKSAEQKTRKRIDAKGWKKALEPIYNEAIRLMPRPGDGRERDPRWPPSGLLSLSLKTGTHVFAGRVFGDLFIKAPHAHLIEFGHRRFDFHGKPLSGRVAPRPFMRPAFAAKGEEAVQIFLDELHRVAREEGLISD